MSRHLTIIFVAFALVAAFNFAASSDNSKIHGYYSIHLKEGPVLKALNLLDDEPYLTEAKIFDPKSGDGKTFKPYEFKETSYIWEFDQTDEGFTIQAAGKVAKKGWYLSYDPQAPQHRVVLLKEPIPGSYWDIEFSVVNPSKIRAKNAKLEWWLDVEKDGEVYARGSGTDRVYFKLYSLKLSKTDAVKFNIDHLSK